MLEANLTLIFEDMQRKSKEADEKIAKADKMTAESNRKTVVANKLTEEANRKADDAIKKITEGVKNLLALGSLSLEQIAQVFNMPVEQVMEIKSGMASS